MDFSYTEGNAIDTFHVSDFGAFGQSYRLEDAVDLSGSKSSCTPIWQSLHVLFSIVSFALTNFSDYRSRLGF